LFSVTRSGDLLYVASGAALVVVDVVDFLAPVELGYVNVADVIVDVAASGPRAVALGASGLTFVDATDRSAPEVASTLPIPGSWNVRHVSARNDHAFVPAPDGLHIIDFSDPGAPFEIGAFGAALLVSPGDGRAAFAGPGVIVVADGPAGISVYESCVPFADGFESGDASAWSATGP
jgi:hypothetical protein